MHGTAASPISGKYLIWILYFLIKLIKANLLTGYVDDFIASRHGLNFDFMGYLQNEKNKNLFKTTFLVVPNHFRRRGVAALCSSRKKTSGPMLK